MQDIIQTVADILILALLILGMLVPPGSKRNRPAAQEDKQEKTRDTLEKILAEQNRKNELLQDLVSGSKEG
jgi:hypothetical protein